MRRRVIRKRVSRRDILKKRRTAQERKELKKQIIEQKRQIRKNRIEADLTIDRAVPSSYGGPLDIVYLYIGDDERELKFSINSVRQNFPQHRDIWVVGIKPKTIGNFKYLDAGGGSKGITQKTKNINRKLMNIAACEQISDDFVFMCDDYYFMKPITVERLRLVRARGDYNDFEFIRNLNRYYRGRTHPYKRLLTETIDEVIKKGFYGWDYEIHAPRVINKEKLAKTFQAFGNGFVWTSAYYNMHFAGKPTIIGLDGLDTKGSGDSERVVIRNKMKNVKSIEDLSRKYYFLNHSNKALDQTYFDFLRKRFS